MEKHIKIFKRILKEIGIYNYYIDCRKKRIKNRGLVYESVFSYVTPNSLFCHIIDLSLHWSETFTPSLWCELYEETKGMYCYDLLENDDKINVLRSIVKKQLFHTCNR